MSEMRTAITCNITGTECWNIDALQAYADDPTTEGDIVCTGGLDTNLFGRVCTAMIVTEVAVGDTTSAAPDDQMLEPNGIVPDFQYVRPPNTTTL